MRFAQRRLQESVQCIGRHKDGNRLLHMRADVAADIIQIFAHQGSHEHRRDDRVEKLGRESERMPLACSARLGLEGASGVFRDHRRDRFYCARPASVARQFRQRWKPRRIRNYHSDQSNHLVAEQSRNERLCHRYQPLSKRR